jgi:fibronectin type 3 domain-containing protein
VRANPKRLLLRLLVLAIFALVSCHSESQRHIVTLTWDASPSTAEAKVVGYNVYRRTLPGTPFEKLASHIPGPSYEDDKVNSSTIYFYAVTALDQRGRESRLSNVIRVEIP